MTAGNVRVMVDRETRDSLDRAARFCRLLAAVEHAHMLGDTDEVESLLGQVDPAQAKLDAGAAMQLVVVYDRYTAEPVA